MAGQTYGGGDATTQYTETAMDGGFASRAVSNGNEDTILLRRDHEDTWETVNPRLGAGEIGLVIDKPYFKVGDGTNRWNVLKPHGYDGTIEHSTGTKENSVMSQKAVTEAINNEISNRTNADTAIKNAMVKSCVSTDEAFNDVVKELYLDTYFLVANIKKVIISRNLNNGSDSIWRMIFIDGNNKRAYATFGTGAGIEKNDVNVAIIDADEGFAVDNIEGAKVYAVIQWGKIKEGSEKTFENVSLCTNTVLDVKYYPTISHCIGTHKYSHDIRAIKAIKELYIEGLRKNTDTVSKEDFERYFVVQSIATTPSGKYQIALTDAREVYGTNTEFIYVVNYSVEYDGNSVFYVDCTGKPLKPEINNVATGNKYYFKIYAVVDWSIMRQLENGTYYYPISGAKLLAGCLDKKNSPIICNYIEINKMREELGLRPINEE